MTDFNSKDNINFDSKNFVFFLYNWRKHLSIIAIFTIIFSFIFSSSYFITPLYKSKVIMFPVSSNSVSKALLAEHPTGKEDLMELGETEQAEQMLQILNSSLLRSKIIEKYHLMSHYDIDSTANFKWTRLYQKYKENITFSRTEFMAVEIAVLDQDPQIAADIANNIAALYDTIKNNMQRERALQAFKVVEVSYNKQKKSVKEMEDSLTVLRTLGINDYETQSEMFNKQLAKEIAQNNHAGIEAIQKKLDILSKYGSAYVSIRDALLNEKKQLSLLKTKYEEAKVDAEQAIPQKFIVDRAYKAEKKSYPVRWLIVLISTLAALILAVVIIIIIENTSKKKINFNFK